MLCFGEMYMCLLINRMNDTYSEGRQRKDWRSVIIPHVGWFRADFSTVDLFQSHPDLCLPALFIYPRLFLSSLEPSALCLAWEESRDGCTRTPLWWSVPQQHMCIPVCFLHLHNFMSISVHERPVGVVKTARPQLHNRELHPTWSLKLHHRDPCDLRYLRPPSQLLGAKMKHLETETPFFPFGVKRKCGNKRQRVGESKHVQNSEENKEERKHR